MYHKLNFPENVTRIYYGKVFLKHLVHVMTIEFSCLDITSRILMRSLEFT